MKEQNNLPILSNKTDILNNLIGKTVTGFIRYSWWNAEESFAECNFLEVLSEKKDVFSLTAGPAYIEFGSELAIGVSSNPSLNSVIMWLEFSKEYQKSELMCDDHELFPIDASDPEYSDIFFKEIIGEKLLKFEIIKREPKNVLFCELPREVALVLTFSNGSKLVLSHGLHDNSDDFSVLRWKQVDKEVYKSLYKTSQFWD